MENLSAGDLRIEVTSLPTALQLVWHGKSDDRYPAKILQPYFAEALQSALDRSVPLEMHFQHLAHFNSSTITSIIRLIQDARGRAVKLVLLYNQALKWQKLSFDALRVFAKDDLLELRSV